MRDYKRVEAVNKLLILIKAILGRPIMVQKPVPKEIGSISITKLTPDEREKSMKEGSCLSCREKCSTLDPIASTASPKSKDSKDIYEPFEQNKVCSLHKSVSLYPVLEYSSTLEMN